MSLPSLLFDIGLYSRGFPDVSLQRKPRTWQRRMIHLNEIDFFCFTYSFTGSHPTPSKSAKSKSGSSDSSKNK